MQLNPCRHMLRHISNAAKLMKRNMQLHIADYTGCHDCHGSHVKRVIYAERRIHAVAWTSNSIKNHPTSPILHLLGTIWFQEGSALPSRSPRALGSVDNKQHRPRRSPRPCWHMLRQTAHRKEVPRRPNCRSQRRRRTRCTCSNRCTRCPRTCQVRDIEGPHHCGLG